MYNKDAGSRGAVAAVTTEWLNLQPAWQERCALMGSRVLHSIVFTVLPGGPMTAYHIVYGSVLGAAPRRQQAFLATTLG